MDRSFARRASALLLSVFLLPPLSACAAGGQTPQSPAEKPQESILLTESVKSAQTEETGESAELSSLPAATDPPSAPPTDSPAAPTEPTTPTPTKEIVMRRLELNFDKTDLVSTEYDPKTKKSGAKTEYPLWYSTDYIDVSSDYALVYNLAVHKYLYSVAFFDADRNFLSGEYSMTVSRCATARALCAVPESAVYARFINFVSGSGSFFDYFVEGLESREDCDEYLRQHPRAGLKIALLGDSLTEGDQGTNTPGYSYMNYRNYPYYLSEILGCTAENFGKCGYTTESYLMCYPSEVDVSDADVILVMLGTNAGMAGKSLQQRYRSLLKQIDKDKKEGAAVVLVTPPHATEIEGKVNYGYNPNVVSAAEYVRSYAASKGYLLIDAYADSPIQEKNEALYQPNDGLHMNSTGYEAFAGFIADRLIALGVIG